MVDLTPARQALEEARRNGAAEPARECLTRAESALAEAERLATAPDAASRQRADWLARLSTAESSCATLVARAASPKVVSPSPVPSADKEIERLRARMRKAEEEQKKAEERVLALQRDLDLTETEFIRAKARLKGIETKAEASSAVAEARILMLRLKDEKGSAASVARVQEKLDRAEQQLQEGNFGAAIFFAMRAKELLDPARAHATLKKPQDPARTPSER